MLTHKCIDAHIHTQYIHIYSHAYKYMHACLHTHAHTHSQICTHTYPPPYCVSKLKVNRLQVPGPIFFSLAPQADIKLEGIPVDIALEAVDRGVTGQHEILDIMNATQSEPRSKRKENGPVIEEIELEGEIKHHLLKNGGINIRKLIADTGK